MGCGSSRHQTEIELGIPIRLHHQMNNNINRHNDQNKPCSMEEEESVKSYITTSEEDNSSTPKFKYNQERLYVEGSHDQDFDHDDDDDDVQRRICSSSPSFKIYLPEPENLGQEKEKDGDGGNNKNGGQCVYHQFQETIMEKEEAKKGVLKKSLFKYRIMMLKRWR